MYYRVRRPDRMKCCRIAAAIVIVTASAWLAVPAAEAVTPVEGVSSAMAVTGLDALTEAVNGLARRQIELVAKTIGDADKRKRFVAVLNEQFKGDTLLRLIETSLLNGYDADVYEAVLNRFDSAAARQMRHLDAECRKREPGAAPLQLWQALADKSGDATRRNALLKLAEDSRAAAMTDAAIVALQKLTVNVRNAILGNDAQAAGDESPALSSARKRWLVRRDAAWMAWCYHDVSAVDLNRFDQIYLSQATTTMFEAYQRALVDALSRIGKRATDRLNF